jgi:hypothetical protein
MHEIPCPDGYLLAAASPVADGHHALNTYLVRFEEEGWKLATKELNAIRDKRLKVRIWKALLDRLAWLHANNPAGPYFKQFHDLNYAIEAWKLAPFENDLIEILDQTGRLAGIVSPYTVMPHLMTYVEQHGLTPALSAAIRQFDTRTRAVDFYVNQVRLQLFNANLDMLAWRDEWNDIDLTRCWSEQIRADFRAMQGPVRESWRKLLHSIEGDMGVRPSPKWVKNAESQIQAIGADAFEKQLSHWFEPLRSGATVRLSREGSFILRRLMFLAQSLAKPELTARLGEIADVQFKPKKNGEKVIRAAAEAIGKPDPTANPPSAPAMKVIQLLIGPTHDR